MDNYQLFNEKLKCVDSIVSLYEKIDEYISDDKTSKRSDLLRAVVLLHSFFENYFRVTIKLL